MQGGDLSNKLVPRWLFIFEGVIANIRPERQGEYRRAMRLNRWKKAARCWEIEPHVQKVLWDLTWRRDYKFDIVTFLGDDMADAIKAELDTVSLPFSNCWPIEDEDSLATRLAYMPDVLYVVHADPSRRLAYGNRGLLVTDPGALNLW